MRRDLRNKLLVFIGIFVLVAFVLYISATLLSNVAKNLFPSINGARCIYEIINDGNGNGKYDQGEQAVSLPTLIVDVNDPQGSDSGRYAPANCYINPTQQDRIVHLHIILPPGYRATLPNDLDVKVFSSTHFADYPPQTTLFVQQVAQ